MRYYIMVIPFTPLTSCHFFFFYLTHDTERGH